MIDSAVYTIVRECGHKQKVWLQGTEAERLDELEARAAMYCRECWTAEAQARCETLDAEFESAYPHLPRLTGTEKQITWARTIRSRSVPLIEQVNSEAIAEFDSLAETTPAMAEEYDVTVGYLVNAGIAIMEAAQAAFWIKNRFNFETAESTRAAMERLVDTARTAAAAEKALGTVAKRSGGKRR